MNRVIALLHSTVPRESRRLDVLFVQGLFITFACLSVLFSQDWQDSIAVGPALLRIQFAMSMAVAFTLALRLAGDSAGDLQSGLLEGLFLTGTTAFQWLLVRLSQMWIIFLSVVFVIAPLVTIAYTFGGVGLGSIVASALLLLTWFLVTSSLALLGSIKAKSRSQPFALLVAGLLAWEGLLRTPYLIARALRGYFEWQISIDVDAMFEQLADLSVFSSSRLAASGTFTLAQLWPTIAAYLALSALVLARCWYLFAACARGALTAADVDPATVAGNVRLVRRKRRRAWDDAFAWQAYCIHGLGRRVVRAKSIAYTVIAVGLALLAWAGFREPAAVIAGGGSALLLILAIDKPSDCIKREIRDRTMPMLLLTPHHLEEILAGWQRGAMRLAYPEIALWAAATLAAFVIAPVGPLVLFTVGATLLCSGPFWCLWSLLGFSSEGILTAGTLVPTAALIVAACCWLAVAVHPLLLPITAIPAAYLFNRLLSRLVLRYWMHRNIERII